MTQISKKIFRGPSSREELLEKLELEQTLGWHIVSPPYQEDLMEKLIRILEDMYALAEVNHPDLDHLVEKW